ncbi:YrrS family protein [Virgibacillus necropolis]|uniref:YrrS family protein n=1 Tax=Virgibacillus necropolis TaxID=163877 RepID=UPI00384A6F24
MNDFNNSSRVDKFEKRRKNTKSISLFLVLGGILIIFLLGMFLFGGDDEAENGQPSTESSSDNSGESNDEDTKDGTSSDENDESTTDDSANSDDSSNGETEDPNANDDQSTTDDNSDNSDVEKENVEVSDDPNVKEAYTADWQPIGTEQQGPHTKNFDEGAQDRIEMEKAARVATGIQQGDMITWWLDNVGGQDVIATVSNKAQDNTYRVYLTWVDNEGWKPTKVEVLKENDKD